MRTLCGTILAAACALGAVANPTAIHIQRTMKALEESTAERPATVRVLFYGQSIVAQGWTGILMKMLKERYPTVNFVWENRAIGGFESPNLSRTAWSDLYPFYPDLLFFHVYGPIDKYEEIVRNTRAMTTAEIVLWSSHVRRDEDPGKMLAERNRRTKDIEAVAERNKCMFVDLNRKWSELLVSNGWEAGRLLKDVIHLDEKTDALKYYAGFIGEELRRIPGADGESDVSGTITEVPLDRGVGVETTDDGAVRLRFFGNRVVAVSDGRGYNPAPGAAQPEADIFLDGRPVADYREMWHCTRPSVLVSWMPMIRRVSFDALPVKEDWTLTYLDGTDPWGKPVHYRVEGSVTGYDGEGWSTNDFKSASGRVVIESADCHFVWQYAYFVKNQVAKNPGLKEKAAKSGDRITWKTLPLFADPFAAQKAGGLSVLVQNCANGSHVLEIRPKKKGGAIPGIGKFIVYSPAMHSGGKGAASAATFHVDPTAVPGGDGSRARPFATLSAARDGIRAARASGRVAKDERVDVVLAPGDYFETLALDARDGGASASAPVTWRAAKAGTVRVIGAKRVPASSFMPVTDAAVLARIPAEAKDRVWCADVSELFPKSVPEMAKSFHGLPSAPILFVNHRIGTLARWPNDGFATFATRVDRGMPADASAGAFVYSGPRAKRWNFGEGVWMNGYWTHDWHDHSVKVASYGTENGTNGVVRLAAKIPYGVMGSGTWGSRERRFYVFNLLDELDAPGEWWLDRARKILYLCPPSRAMKEGCEVFLASSGTPLLESRGAVSHVRFEGISFEYSYGTAVVLSGSDIRLENCRVLCCGAGVVLRGDGNLMRGCEVAHVGGRGVNADGGDRRTLRRADSVFEGNHVHDFGVFQRTYAPGFNVGGCGIVLRGNVIHDAPHTAVLYGGNDHLFEYNNVYRVLLETGDAGAYYTGRDWTTQGNVLRFNYTHDLGAEGEHASTMGFYFDDCDCGDEVYGNVFHNVSRGIMVGGGREHPIRNNIFSHCRVGLSIDRRGVTWGLLNKTGNGWGLEAKAKAFSYTNGVWAARYPRLADIMNDHPGEPLYNPVENNVFIDCRSQLVVLDKVMPLELMAPIANNVVVNTRGTNGVEFASPDPRIASGFTILNGATNAPCAFGVADAERGDFRFLPGSEVLKVCPGFAPLPLDRIPPAIMVK